jgi:hypothetical protein
MDYNHGFSLQPVNINIQVIPGYEHVVKMTPTKKAPTPSSATNSAASATTRCSAVST